jgi:hypothetical protein
MAGRAIMVLALAGAAGFVVGFAIGRGTRDALPSSTSTEFAHGVLTIRVDASKALRGGLAALFS